VGGAGVGGGQLRARVCNAAAAAVEVHSAVDAAAAMQSMLSDWKDEICQTTIETRITVDPHAGCVSYEQMGLCIIFSVDGGPRVQFVQVKGLPPSFIDVRQAQEVRENVEPRCSFPNDLRRRTVPCRVRWAPHLL
jgi:hypothetical protein